MTARELREKYLRFFEKRGHKKLPNLPLVPENDPSTLFISAGMQPLVPYLLGQPHPLGKRLVSLQRCLRTVDIENVGDISHNTFFEMLGNWSLGDYWKKESLNWSLEFLTKVLGLDPKKLHVTVFRGDKTAPKDEESEEIWLSLGIPKERIYFLPKKDNWWEAGETGPGGPDSEIFYDVGKPACNPNCRPGDNCGRFFEMWNNVFMEYNRDLNGSYEKLKQKNVDTGMGVERTIVILQGADDVFQTDVFIPIISEIEKLSGQSYQEEKNKKPMRIIADHLRAAVFLLADGVLPSNVERGYVLRRLIRRAIRYGRILQYIKPLTGEIARAVIETYKDTYPEIQYNEEGLFNILNNEEEKFSRALNRGLKELDKILARQRKKVLGGQEAFFLYESYGFPLELTREILLEKGVGIDEEGFRKKLLEHQEKSRIGAKEKFAGGLADHSEIATRFHTATHLLQATLRKILGSHIRQVGSNITAERARFDFTHPQNLTNQEIETIEKLINQKIEESLPVTKRVMSPEEAKKQGALAFFGEKYPDQISVYSVGSFSKEICGGPHVTNTGKIGRIKIVKEEGAGAGKRRIYLKLKTV